MSNGSGMFSDQSPVKRHLVEGKTGVAGEVNDLRGDVGRTIAGLLATTVDEYTNVPVADPDALMADFASQAAAVTYSAAQGEFTGVLTDGIIDVASAGPRQVTVTTDAAGTPADAPANVVIYGLDAAGRVQQETLAVSQVAGTATSVNWYAAVLELRFEAGDGTGATLRVGFAGDMGLRQPIVSRAGVLHALEEIDPVGGQLLGAAITATFSDAATSPPFGSVAPTTAVDGARDYAYVYEYDPTVVA